VKSVCSTRRSWRKRPFGLEFQDRLLFGLGFDIGRDGAYLTPRIWNIRWINVISVGFGVPGPVFPEDLYYWPIRSVVRIRRRWSAVYSRLKPRGQCFPSNRLDEEIRYAFFHSPAYGLWDSASGYDYKADSVEGFLKDLYAATGTHVSCWSRWSQEG